MAVADSSGDVVYMPTSRMIIETVILKDKSRSSMTGGTGITMTIRIAMAANPMAMSEFLPTNENFDEICC